MVKKLVRWIRQRRKPPWYMMMPTGTMVATERFINKIAQQPKPPQPEEDEGDE